MKKIPCPTKSFNEMLAKCADGMSQKNVRINFLSHLQTFLQIEQQYKTLSLTGLLFLYPKTEPLTDTTLVIGDLTKTKLENLYDNNLRNKEKPARDFYDKLMVSSGEKCPFCGDIGQTRNLDHFLPKAHFPEFSVMPLNLVPSCRDCNMGEKGASFATTEVEQTLHPYIDKDIFFQNQWVFADYVNEDTGAIEYHVNCPVEWRQEDKDRARNHFVNLNIAHRYSLEAGKHLSEIIDQKNSFKTMIRCLVPQISSESIIQGFIDAVLQPVIDSHQFKNHWKRVMYQCLKDSCDFFNDI
ncbi:MULTISPECIES: HNH endonuclease [Enterobacteriaceae]|uniref:HNH nuclease domain-containing protein n=2 Tax=Shigella TaxID=620 RepID=A0A1S9IXC7_SHIBO|nr:MULTISPECIES: HNH endonuclease [Enterobacteriaceae]EGD7153160.1 HNH endonuclease [Shigella dysenteriae]EFC6289729.1 HNH endonuclease [Escherichia coli]EFL7063558.1 HNH endonuclease [Escherichia coli]EGE2519680.1 HNH endonuclease [Shigella dysenteriae]EHX4646194.1 HNH endonuclease [Shigella dysenteriae]